jgi:predicted TIM-barrel fold metal-dependent hydrolase
MGRRHHPSHLEIAMIVDCHVHLNNYEEDTVESLSRRLAELNRVMRLNRVDIALVLTSYKVTPGRPSTGKVIGAIADQPHLYVVAGLSHDRFDPGELAELEPHVASGKLKGLKLYPGYESFYPNDPKWEPAYQFAARHRLPVMIHSGDTYDPRGKVKYAHPLHVDEVAVDHPGVNFVICHLGNPWIRDCMEVVYKNANVYTDLSGFVLGDFSDRFEAFMSRQVQDMLLYGVEPENVLYGTDWPIASMEGYLEFMEQIAIPRQDRQRIMSDNALALYRIDPATSLLSGGSGGARWRQREAG